MKLLSKFIRPPRIPVFLITLFLFFSPFSNAPAYIHPVFSLPLIVGSIIILFFLIELIAFPKNVSDYFEIFGLGVIMVFFLYYVFNGDFSTKSTAYFLAHVWFLLLTISLSFYGRTLNFSRTRLSSAIFFPLILTGLWILGEAFLPFLDIDLGSYIPRIERNDYIIYSGLGFYRVRGFNYESAYLAMYFNSIFPLLIFLYRKHSLLLWGSWLLCLLLTLSIAQILLLISFALLFFFRWLMFDLRYLLSANDRFKLEAIKGKIAYVGVGCFILLVLIMDGSNAIYYWIEALFSWIGDNLSGETPSARQRIDKFMLGWSLLKEGWPLGLGFGGIQQSGIAGVASFYFAALIQLGILSISLFGWLGFVAYRIWISRNYLIWISFGCVFGHLMIIDVFYLPQVFFPILLWSVSRNSSLNYNERTI